MSRSEQRLILSLVARAIERRGRLSPKRARKRRAGIISAIHRGSVGNREWGVSMQRARGGRALSRHGRVEQLKNLARAREVKAARRAWDVEHGIVASKPARKGKT